MQKETNIVEKRLEKKLSIISETLTKRWVTFLRENIEATAMDVYVKSV